MTKKVYISDLSQNRRNVPRMFAFDVDQNRRKIVRGFVYDLSGNRRQFFSSGLSPSAANFTMVAGELYDNSEGTVVGYGIGFYASTTDSSGTTVPPYPPSGVAGTTCHALFTTNGGNAGFPQNLLLYVVNGLNVPNTDESFATLTIPGIGTFSRASATYNGNSQGSGFSTEWVWTYGGPYLVNGSNYSAEFA